MGPVLLYLVRVQGQDPVPWRTRYEGGDELLFPRTRWMTSQMGSTYKCRTGMWCGGGASGRGYRVVWEGGKHCVGMEV